MGFEVEPRSRGFPERLFDRPFYGRVTSKGNISVNEAFTFKRHVNKRSYLGSISAFSTRPSATAANASFA